MAEMSKCQQLLRGFELMPSPLKHFDESTSDMFQDILDWKLEQFFALFGLSDRKHFSELVFTFLPNLKNFDQ